MKRKAKKKNQKIMADYQKVLTQEPKTLMFLIQSWPQAVNVLRLPVVGNYMKLKKHL